ncbi:hypothetical protein HMPREF9135_0874 [Segatella baroniae F0067]|uniref:Uncharacterized protein n=1 Tax=Segatella baroniae F0067 TaxID=1115809 RepID=U2P3X4_9BACT|nr:hypothetical protein HMPREF9135_0874 [Segatella baroniae F0067]
MAFSDTKHRYFFAKNLDNAGKYHKFATMICEYHAKRNYRIQNKTNQKVTCLTFGANRQDSISIHQDCIIAVCFLSISLQLLIRQAFHRLTPLYI